MERRPARRTGAMRCAIGVAAGFTLAVAQAQVPAAALEPPSGSVLLVVDGNIGLTNVGDEAHWDRAMLETLERHAFTTTTPWREGEQRFEGALLKSLLDAVAAGTYRFRAMGVDDYAAEFVDVDLERFPVIIADRHEGAPMTVRQLGPLRIVFPFDDHPTLRTHANEARSVWQLIRMTVR